jgi:SAM-dependent methyltransferase
MLQNCTVCGNRLTPRLPQVLDPLTGETFAIHTCTVCGLGHTLPQPQDLSRYYGPVYHGSRHGFTAQHCTRRRLGFLAAATVGDTGRRLLDIGCGDGSFLLAARDAGWEVMGTELNPKLARAAGLDVKESLEQVQDDSAFDCTTMWHSLEHMRDVKSTLVRVSRLLKPTGTLIIAVPHAGGLQARLFGRYWLHLDVPRHLYHFDAGSLSSCLDVAGFTPQRWWHQELEYDLMGWSQSALNALFPVPNLFLDSLMGKPGNVGSGMIAANLALGSFLSALFLPAVPACTLFHSGGTLVVAAKKTA